MAIKRIPPHRIGLRKKRSASSSGFPLGKPDPQGGSDFFSRRSGTYDKPRVPGFFINSLSGGYEKAMRPRRAEGVLVFLAPLTRGGRGGCSYGVSLSRGLSLPSQGVFQQPLVRGAFSCALGWRGRQRSVSLIPRDAKNRARPLPRPACKCLLLF